MLEEFKTCEPKDHKCFTPDQRMEYLALPTKQRVYVDYRGKGYNRADAYRLAGNDVKNYAQAAHNFEARNPIIVELVNAISNERKLKELENSPEAKINKTINALATQKKAQDALAVIENASTEDARRIAFYRDIINGKIKTVKVIKLYDADGSLKSRRVEEASDVNIRILARKELDKILGVNIMPKIDSLNVGGDITINIVDASIKRELKDERDKIELDPDKVEIIDGEECLVQEEIKG